MIEQVSLFTRVVHSRMSSRKESEDSIGRISEERLTYETVEIGLLAKSQARQYVSLLPFDLVSHFNRAREFVHEN